MRIAVIIPTFDRPQRLEEALASVAEQSRVPDEVHVVVDAGPSIVRLENQFSSRFLLQVHRLEENRGQAAARNHGLARIRSDAVAFLDDDDLFLERHLERLERALQEDPSLALVYDDCEIRRGEETGSRRIAHDYDPGLMRRYDYIPPACWLMRGDAVTRAGGFDESFRCYEDWDLLLRLEAWGGMRRVPGPGAVIRIGAASQSLRTGEPRLSALERFQAKHGLQGIEPLTFWEVAEAVAG
jgi:glycosyltransferase involved in cell wall biosynthesis